MFFSFIIPVYNRPNEIEELLNSLSKLLYEKPYEIVIIEDGSTLSSEKIVAKYQNSLDITYLIKENSGPGDSRNYGMQRAKGDYFIILDSDCIVPEKYLLELSQYLQNDFVDCFGGPDAAHESFTTIQKAINFSMTSFLTTGGIRGGNETVNKFQPRSFNMGLSKKAFLASKGFGTIHPGEDPDLSIRLWNLGYQTKLFKKAFVYHKRRIDWHKFYIQVNKFGKVRPILNLWHPTFTKITFWFPSLFIIGFFTSIVFSLFSIPIFSQLYFTYFIVVFLVSIFQNKSVLIGFYSIIATGIQFYGYGTGFLVSYLKIHVLKQHPKEAFPKLFF
jgi:glycosyltransferase involved in cell wall biosynthesis